MKAIEMILALRADPAIESSIELAVLTALVLRADEGGLAYPALSTIAQDARCSRRAVIEILKRAQRRGRGVRVVKVRSGRGRTNNIYQIVLDPDFESAQREVHDDHLRGEVGGESPAHVNHVHLSKSAPGAPLTGTSCTSDVHPVHVSRAPGAPDPPIDPPIDPPMNPSRVRARAPARVGARAHTGAREEASEQTSRALPLPTPILPRDTEDPNDPAVVLTRRAQSYLRDPTAASLNFGSPHQWVEVRDVIATWNEVWDQRVSPANSGDPRVEVIVARLADGCTLQQLREAIQGACKDEWLEQKPKLQSLVHILRDADKVDAYRRLLRAPSRIAPVKGAPKVQPATGSGYYDKDKFGYDDAEAEEDEDVPVGKLLTL